MKTITAKYAEKVVFIHRSIKTRIETTEFVKKTIHSRKFLYIDPLKQGLKRKLFYTFHKYALGFYT